MAGPIPLHRYRAFKRGKREARRPYPSRPISSPCPWPPWRRRPPAATADRPTDQPAATPHAAFDADALEYHFPTTVAAKLAIAQELGLPLSKLSPDARAFIDHVLEDTRMRRLVLGRIHFRAKPSGADHAG